MNISVVIPNYNGLEGLKVLLPQIVKFDFKHIYVIDDNSSDGSVSYAQSFPKIRVIQGKQNVGAGANRNRILDQPTASVIWFVDADMVIKTKNKNDFEKMLSVFKDKKVGVVGSQIFSKNGDPMFWNYGYEMHPQRDAVVPVLEKIFTMFSENKEVADYVRKIAKNYYFNLEIKKGVTEKEEVDWVAEGNFFIRSSLFKRMKGFDSLFRFHEAQDLCRRIRDTKKKVLFRPYVKTLHTELEVRGEKRIEEFYSGAKLFYQKHWQMPDLVFETLAKNHTELIKKLKKV